MTIMSTRGLSLLHSIRLDCVLLCARLTFSSIWKWRTQYTDVLGGLGTGIGDGDRGVICGRETGCCAGREREQETDCEAEDAAQADADANNNIAYISGFMTVTPSPPSYNGSSSLSDYSTSSGSSSNGGASSSSSYNLQVSPQGSPRTPSPVIKAGYERHEIEGIGGVMKKKRLRMVKVGACVPEWADERAAGQIMGREVNGKVRSWCGWCWRVIPGASDYRDMFNGGGDEEKGGKGKERMWR